MVIKLVSFEGIKLSMTFKIVYLIRANIFSFNISQYLQNFSVKCRKHFSIKFLLFCDGFGKFLNILI